MKNLENFGGDDELSSMTKVKKVEEEPEDKEIASNLFDYKSDGTEREHPYPNQDGPNGEEYDSRDYYKKVLEEQKKKK
ncbi:MAG: hypothetical protein WCW65_03430 [Candidatus Paceibacterota bacterium]